MEQMDALLNEKDQGKNSEDNSSDNSHLSITNFAKKNIARVVIFYTWFSGVEFLLFFACFFSGLIKPIILSNIEMRISLIMFCVIFVSQILRLKWCHEQTRKIYIRVLTATCLLWLISNAIFYFSSTPMLILLFFLLAAIGVFLHPLLPVMYSELCFDFLRKPLMPTRAVMSWFMPKFLERFLSASQNAFARVKFYYSNDETIFLLYLVSISFLCLFTILGQFLIAIIIMLFFIVNVRTITNFKPSARYKYKEPHDRSKWNPCPVSNYFSKSTMNPFSLFQSVGSAAFISVFVFSNKFKNLPFSFQLTIWGVCLWNIAMSEIHLYARIFLEEIRIRYRENNDDVYQK